jgi:hypothetical protein
MCSGYVWYVHHTGTDAAGTAGRDKQKPLATLAQAHTNASAGDLIYFLEGHTQVLAASQTFNKAGIILASEGTGTSRASFTRNADVVMFDITAAGVQMHNLWLPQSTIAISAANPNIRTAAASTLLEGCELDCGALDLAPGLQLNTGADRFEARDCTFVSTSTSLTAQPLAGIKVNQAVSDMRLVNVTIDGGTVGWSTPHGFNGAAAVTRLTGRNFKLIRNSDAIIATGGVGLITLGSASASARVEWTP